jgi:hypothetical protein
VQFREVRRAVDEGPHHVALGPGRHRDGGRPVGSSGFRVRSKSGTTASGADASWAHSIATWRRSAVAGQAPVFTCRRRPWSSRRPA